MPDTYSQCPKCRYKPEVALPNTEPCPSCGIYIFKWQSPQIASIQSDSAFFHIEEDGIQYSSFFQPMNQMNPLVFYGRCLMLLLLIIWSSYLVTCDYRNGEIFGSFMHGILLTIHEAGHMLFGPFGEFIAILGGSLFQWALPLGIGIAFVVVNRDNFGAALGVWWSSVSVLDLSPYIYDAFRPQLIMLGGHTGEDGPHDWIYLLGTFGQIRNAQQWGSLVHVIGSVLVVAALAWAVAVLWRQRGQLE